MKTSNKLLILLLHRSSCSGWSPSLATCPVHEYRGTAQPDLDRNERSDYWNRYRRCTKGRPDFDRLGTAEARATATTRRSKAPRQCVQPAWISTSTPQPPLRRPSWRSWPFTMLTPSSVMWAGSPPPRRSTVTGYQQTKVAMAPVTAADFVLASDITWDSRYASGCGFMFRLNGDPNKPNAYMFIISRVATGHAVFTALVNGELANIHDFYPKDNDKSFNSDNEGNEPDCSCGPWEYSRVLF